MQNANINHVVMFSSGVQSWAAAKRDDIAILRQQKNGHKSTITLQEFRQQIESEPVQLNLFDEAFGGCGCFTDTI